MVVPQDLRSSRGRGDFFVLFFDHVAEKFQPTFNVADVAVEFDFRAARGFGNFPVMVSLLLNAIERFFQIVGGTLKGAEQRFDFVKIVMK